MPEEDSNLFVRFEQPMSLRKSLLEASRNVLVSLQNFEKFREARNEKAELMSKLKGQLSDINQLFNRLKKEMPKSSATKLKPRTIVSKPVQGVEESAGEIKSIEDQLSSIESMLGNMG